MSRQLRPTVEAIAACALVALFFGVAAEAQTGPQQPEPTPQLPRDAIGDAQTPAQVPMERPEQKKTPHDLSDIFAPATAVPSSDALSDQPEHGGMSGFDFYRDPLGAMKPGVTFGDIYKAGVAGKPKAMALQKKLLESRYNLEPRLDPAATMSRGKPIVLGPTAPLAAGDRLGRTRRDEPGGNPSEGHLPL